MKLSTNSNIMTFDLKGYLVSENNDWKFDLYWRFGKILILHHVKSNRSLHLINTKIREKISRAPRAHLYIFDNWINIYLSHSPSKITEMRPFLWTTVVIVYSCKPKTVLSLALDRKTIDKQTLDMTDPLETRIRFCLDKEFFEIYTPHHSTLLAPLRFSPVCQLPSLLPYIWYLTLSSSTPWLLCVSWGGVRWMTR